MHRPVVAGAFLSSFLFLFQNKCSNCIAFFCGVRYTYNYDWCKESFFFYLESDTKSESFMPGCGRNFRRMTAHGNKQGFK